MAIKERRNFSIIKCMLSKKANPNIITYLFLTTIQQIKLISSQIQLRFTKNNTHHSSTAAIVIQDADIISHT